MDFGALCVATGIEPSRLRYFETEFREFFPVAATSATADSYDARAVALFEQLDRWMFAEGKTVSDIRQVLIRQAQPSDANLRIFAVTSGKGGVGKTTVSLNLAIALASRGQRTLLIDADMGLGNVHVLAGIQPHGTILDVVEQRASIADILSAGPGGIQILCGASGVPELADLATGKLDTLMQDVVRLSDRFDAVVIDTAAGIAAQVTRFLFAADEIVVVTTPNIAATLDAYGVIKVAREAQMRARLHVVVNMVSSNAQAATVYARLRDCAQRFLQYAPAHLGQLQKHGSVERANQNRRPLLVDAPDSINARRLQIMADALLALPSAAESAVATPRALPLDLFVNRMARAS